MRWHNRRFVLVVIKGKPHRPDVLDVYATSRPQAKEDKALLEKGGHVVEIREFGKVVG